MRYLFNIFKHTNKPTAVGLKNMSHWYFKEDLLPLRLVTKSFFWLVFQYQPTYSRQILSCQQQALMLIHKTDTGRHSRKIYNAYITDFYKYIGGKGYRHILLYLSFVWKMYRRAIPNNFSHQKVPRWEYTNKWRDHDEHIGENR